MEPVTEITLAALLALAGLFTDGLKALQDKQYDPAIANLTKVYEASTPANVWRELALYFRAEAHQGKGEKDLALADLKALVQLTTDKQLQRQARDRFVKWGGNPKDLPPADSPKAVWAKLMAAGKNGQARVFRDLCTGELRKMFYEEIGDDAEPLKGYVKEMEKAEVVDERLGIKEEAGKAWLRLKDPRTGELTTLGLVLDDTGTHWLFSDIDRHAGAQAANAQVVAIDGANLQQLAARLSPDQTSMHNAGNLKQIGLALLMYSGEHNGLFPPNLDVLDEQDILNKGPVYLWTNAQTGEAKLPFIYRPGLKDVTVKDDDPAATTKMLAASPAPNNGRREVLFVDGHVEAMLEAKFQEQVKAQGWVVPGALKKADIPADKQEKIRALVKKLGDASFQVRRQAKTDLKAMGVEAHPVLEEFLKADDVEVRTAVKEILDGK